MKQLLFILQTCLLALSPYLSEAQQPAAFYTPDTATTARLVSNAQIAIDSGRYQIALDQSLQLIKEWAAASRPGGNDLFQNRTALIAGRAYYHLGNLDASIAYLEKASVYFEAQPEADKDIYNAIVAYYLAMCRQQLGDYSAAVSYHERALKIKQFLYGKANSEVAASYMATAKTYQDWGDAGKAIDYCKKGLAVYQKRFGIEHKESANALIKLGDAYYSNSDISEAERCFQNALAIHLRVAPDSINYDVSRCYNQLGRIALNRRNFDLAIQWWEQAKVIRLKFFPSDHPEMLAIYNNLGIGWKNKGAFDMAESYYFKMLQIRQKQLRAGHPDLATPYFNLGACYQLKRDWPKAILYFDTALVLLKGALSPEHPFIAETYYNIGDVYYAWAKETQDAQLLQKTRLAYEKSWELVLDQQKWTKNKASKKQFISQLLTVCEANILAGLQSYGQTLPLDNETLWSFNESAKSRLLMEGISDEYALQFSGIPDSLLEKERVLRSAMTNQKKRLQRLFTTGLPKTDQTVLEAEGLLIDLNLAYESLKTTFERSFPDYFRLKYDQDTRSIASTQSMLTSGQTLLEYFTGDSSIYLFVLRKDTFKVIELDKDFPLSDWIIQLRNGICQYHVASKKTHQLYEQTVKDYADAAQKIYKKLLEPVQQWLTDELIIVPDAELNNLPFEALLTGPPRDLSNFSIYPFLVKSKVVHYGYSATMLHQMITHKCRKPPVTNLLAFAPFFRGDTSQLTARLAQEIDLRRGLQPLPYSGEEVFRIRRKMGQSVDVFTGEDATRQQFIKIAGDYRILHLATHGKANTEAGEFSFLAFSAESDTLEDTLLYVGDLYNLSLNAEMVVLSACETGVGELQRGEGVVSLARAFAFAGAKSIVTSLWSVSDKATMNLMNSFYSGLKQGQSKDVALAVSKRNYISTHPGIASHPFFWAGIVAVGDMAPIK